MTYKEQRNFEIKRLYETGNYSYDKLAKMFGVSKSTICFACNPEAKAKHHAHLKTGKIIKPRPSKKRKFNRQELATNLIESMADFALAFGWNDDLLIKRLLDIGIAKRDFEVAGYYEFVREYFEENAM